MDLKSCFSPSVVFCFVLLNMTFYFECEEFCFSEECNNTVTNRYLFYDINPPEGFNLRRDVYMRFAILARRLSHSNKQNLNNFKLVLPPWSRLVHWQHSEIPEQLPWSLFFELNSLKLFAPVIEMHEFFSSLAVRYKKVKIDEVYILQHFEDMFKTGHFEEKMEIQDCQRFINPSYFFYENITSDFVKCLSFHGSAVNLIDVLKNSSAKTLLFDHAEVALHHRFGDKEYWMARRSMRFNKDLIGIASDFRAKYLNSSDLSDNTVLPDTWTQEKPRRIAVGGPYLAVHLRRRDFAVNRPQQAPPLDSVAEQINEVLNKLQLQKTFIATDASTKEFNLLKSLISIGTVYRYIPGIDVKLKYKDGGVAIIDQIICSHGRYFIGTQESTFSLRIQEEREIIGFPVKTTFNTLCKNKNTCEKPSVWKIVY